MNNESVNLKVEVRFDQAEAAELDQLTTQLRRELLQLDVDDVRRSHAGPPPAGARAVDVVALSQLVVSFGTAAGALASVINAVRDWLDRRTGGSIRVEMDGDPIELTNASDQQQQQLVDAWLARHGAELPDDGRAALGADNRDESVSRCQAEPTTKPGQ
jgi:hypothetical protein